MTATVNVFLKEGVLDPQGKAAHHALDSLGFLWCIRCTYR